VISRRTSGDFRKWHEAAEPGRHLYGRYPKSVAEARNSIGQYLDFYNGRRPHSSLDDMTPDQAYFKLPPLRAAA
jgi:transposase InsO family protein